MLLKRENIFLCFLRVLLTSGSNDYIKRGSFSWTARITGIDEDATDLKLVEADDSLSFNLQVTSPAVPPPTKSLKSSSECSSRDR
jgi:hypothetical protein